MSLTPLPSPADRTGAPRRRAIACATLSLLAACGDSTAPATGSGLYRLATVNASALPYICPPSSTGYACAIYSGELLLRPNATFALAIDGVPFFFDGTYLRQRDSLTFTVPNGDPSQPPIVFTAPAAGDSVRLDLSPPPLVLVFRSSAMPAASITTATYVLTEANGRSGQPVVLGDTVVGGTRYVYRVDFDTLWLKDGVFFRQHRAESSSAYRASGDSLRDESEGTSFGSFTSERGWAVLRRYFVPIAGQSRLDSLAAAGATLTRTTRLITGNRVERYSRVR
jgi:hypothetical protein